MGRKPVFKKLILEIAKAAAESTGEGLITITDIFLNQKRVYRKAFFQDPSQRRRLRHTLSSIVSRLKGEGYLERIERKGKIYYRITDKGRSKLERLIFDREKWDGQWRIVVFDIPENKRQYRDFLRSKLRDLGFRQLQKSVWISPFDNLDEVQYFVNKFELQTYVWCLIGNMFVNDEDIIEKFLL